MSHNNKRNIVERECNGSVIKRLSQNHYRITDEETCTAAYYDRRNPLGMHGNFCTETKCRGTFFHGDRGSACNGYLYSDGCVFTDLRLASVPDPFKGSVVFSWHRNSGRTRSRIWLCALFHFRKICD